MKMKHDAENIRIFFNYCAINFHESSCRCVVLCVTILTRDGWYEGTRVTWRKCHRLTQMPAGRSCPRSWGRGSQCTSRSPCRTDNRSARLACLETAAPNTHGRQHQIRDTNITHNQEDNIITTGRHTERLQWMFRNKAFRNTHHYRIKRCLRGNASR